MRENFQEGEDAVAVGFDDIGMEHRRRRGAGEVDDDVECAEALKQSLVRRVPLNESDSGEEMGGISEEEVIERDNIAVVCVYIAEVRSDEPRAAGHENPLFRHTKGIVAEWDEEYIPSPHVRSFTLFFRKEGVLWISTWTV